MTLQRSVCEFVGACVCACACTRAKSFSLQPPGDLFAEAEALELVINSLLTHHGALCQSSLCLGLSGGWRRRDAGAHFDGPPRTSRPLPRLSNEVMSALSEERLHCSRPPRRLKLLMRPRFWWPRTSTVRRLERHLKNCCLAVPNCNSPLFHYARRSTGF